MESVLLTLKVVPSDYEEKQKSAHPDTSILVVIIEATEINYTNDEPITRTQVLSDKLYRLRYARV